MLRQKIPFVAVFAMWLLWSVALANPIYETQGDRLVVTVPAGESAALDVERLGSQTALVKRGAGVLKTTGTLASFTGDILVEEGVLNAYWTGALGTSDGVTVVSSGASLEIEGPSVAGGSGEITENQLPGLQLFPNERITIAGKGPDGRGALVTRVQARCSNVKYLHGGVLALSADALVRGIQLNHNITEPLELNGHILSLEPGGGVQNYNPEIVSNGDVAVQNGGLNNPAVPFQDDASRAVCLYSGGGIHLEGFTAAFKRRLVCQSDTGYLRISGSAGNFKYDDAGSWSINRNVWDGDIELTNSLKLTRGTAGCAIRINGNVTGPGGLVVGPDIGVLMTGAGCNFKGGVKMNEGGSWLQVSSPACICGDGAAIEIADGTLSFCNWKVAYSLPDAVFSGNTKVKWGYNGCWKRMTKAGAGELYYDSGFGGCTLEISGGGVYFPIAATDHGVTAAPVFSNLVAGAGTYLRFGAAHRVPFAVETLVGCTAVSNGDFTVSKTWTLTSADAASGGVLEVCDGTLRFGEASELVLENERLFPGGHAVEIARANVEIAGSPSIRNSRRYVLRRSGDGRSLLLEPRGFVVLFR